MPPIDVQTLMMVSTLILVLLGSMFLITGVQDRRAPELIRWGASFLVAAPSVVLLSLRGQIPLWASLVSANVLVLASYGLFLSGVLAFDGIRTRIPFTPIVVAIWLALCLVPGFMDAFTIRVVVIAALSGSMMAVVAVVLWRGRERDPLPSRSIGIVIAAVMAVTQFVRATLAVIWPVSAKFTAISGSWMAPTAVILLMQTILAGYIFLSLTKERAAVRHRREAETDHLTGVLTRRAFAAEAQRRLTATPDRGALLFFDLDHFKTINDTHGHAVGDRVLVAFARLVELHAGANDLFGRWGGEEFVLLLADADLTGAHRVAEEIRRAFGRLDLLDDDRSIGATVSAGIGLPALTGPDLDMLIACADAGLYAAKSRGRDRVEPGPLSSLTDVA